MLDFPLFLWYPMPNHDQLKREMLDLFSSLDSREDLMPKSRIAQTTYSGEDANALQEETLRLMKPALDYFQEATDAQAYQVSNGWFQRYEFNDEHIWHTHPQANFGMVYYLELPDGAPSTQIRYKDKVWQPDVKEGDVFFFPAFLSHRSPPNQSGFDKIVFAANVSIL